MRRQQGIPTKAKEDLRSQKESKNNARKLRKAQDGWNGPYQLKSAKETNDNEGRRSNTEENKRKLEKQKESKWKGEAEKKTRQCYQVQKKKTERNTTQSKENDSNEQQAISTQENEAKLRDARMETVWQ